MGQITWMTGRALAFLRSASAWAAVVLMKRMTALLAEAKAGCSLPGFATEGNQTWEVGRRPREGLPR